MPRLTYHNERTVEIDRTTSILAAALAHGIPHTHVCGGRARCSTCRVLVLEGLDHCAPRGPLEQVMAERRHFGPDVRLACQTTVLDDVTLRRLVLDDEDVDLVDDEMAGEAPRSVGEERRLAILFTDIRDFTAFSEAQLPYDVIHVLNRYYRRVHAAVTRHGGRIDNFMGDGVMALFGAEDTPEPVLRAVRAGLDVLAEAAEMDRYVHTQFRCRFRIGIGLHWGPAILGTVGAGERRRLTAIGDAVNLASRIEGANKELGTSFLISADAHAEVREQVLTGRSCELAIKGKTGTYALHEVLGPIPPA